jgi:hypothetical protein
MCRKTGNLATLPKARAATNQRPISIPFFAAGREQCGQFQFAPE